MAVLHVFSFQHIIPFYRSRFKHNQAVFRQQTPLNGPGSCPPRTLENLKKIIQETATRFILLPGPTAGEAIAFEARKVVEMFPNYEMLQKFEWMSCESFNFRQS